VLCKILTGVTLGLSTLAIASGSSPADWEPPQAFYANQGFYGFEGSEFTFRWTADASTNPLESFIYEACTWIDIQGPACPNELIVDIEFYGENDVFVGAGVDVVPALGRRSLRAVEVGTNSDFQFESFLLTFVRCGVGLPTGLADV
jgi:hypothetical protein